MKSGVNLEKIILICVSLIALLVIGVYVGVGLVSDWSISSNPIAWGPVGDYFGGLLNPVIALAALIALIRATKFQRHEFQATRAHLESEAKKNEIYRLITNFEQKIERKLEAEVRNDRGSPEMILGPLSQYMHPGWKPPVKTYIAIGNSGLCTELRDYSKQILDLLGSLEKLLNEYDAINGEESTLSRYLTDLYRDTKVACREQCSNQT